VQAFDTNVVVRLILGDEPKQTALATECWKEALARGGVYLSRVVLVEIVWVLSFSAKLGRKRNVNFTA